MNRKHWLIAMVLFWIAAVLNAFTMLWQWLWHRDFDWPSFLVFGLTLVAALSMTGVWWKLKDAKTD